jgi:prophage antirepressor-like protein
MIRGEVMNELQKVFNYHNREVRTVIIENEPWFVAKDVCEVLEIGNTTMAVQRLPDLMKGVNSIDTLGGKQQVSIVSESGVYKLVFTSRKPEAEKFTDWLATEVIPSIRKTGTYINISGLSPSLQMAQQLLESMVQQELRLKQTEQTITNIKETIVNIPDDWRESINRTLNKIAQTIGQNEFRNVKAESYKLLEARAGCDLERRLMFYKARLATDGKTNTAVKQANKLDVIEADKKLREIYSAIVKELAVKFLA